MDVLNTLCIAAYVILLGSLQTRDSMFVLLAFGASVLYTSSPAWLMHTDWMNHVVISLFFIPIIWFVTFPVFLAVSSYVVYHWVVAGDYIFFNNDVTFVSKSFIYVSPTLNLLMMLAIIYASYNKQYNSRLDMAGGWLSHILGDKGKHT